MEVANLIYPIGHLKIQDGGHIFKMAATVFHRKLQIIANVTNERYKHENWHTYSIEVAL